MLLYFFKLELFVSELKYCFKYHAYGKYLVFCLCWHKQIYPSISLHQFITASRLIRNQRTFSSNNQLPPHSAFKMKFLIALFNRCQSEIRPDSQTPIPHDHLVPIFHSAVYLSWNIKSLHISTHTKQFIILLSLLFCFLCVYHSILSSREPYHFFAIGVWFLRANFNRGVY